MIFREGSEFEIFIIYSYTFYKVLSENKYTPNINCNFRKLENLEFIFIITEKNVISCKSYRNGSHNHKRGSHTKGIIIFVFTILI